MEGSANGSEALTYAKTLLFLARSEVTGLTNRQFSVSRFKQ